MPSFAYVARDLQGRVQRNNLRAKNSHDLISRLREQGLTVTEIRQQKKVSSLSLFQPRIKVNDIAVFSRQFASMIEAGIQLAPALDIMVKQTENPTLSKMTEQVKTEVEGGASLSESLAKHPKAFDDLYTNMVKAGEISGTLPTILNQLATLLEKRRALQNKIKSSLFLPVLVLGFCIVMTIGLIIFVVPRFAAVFEEVGAALPRPTQILVGISEDMRGPKGGIFFVSVILFAFAFRKVIKTEKGGYVWDRTKLKLPLFGSLIMKKVVATFARIFGLLDHSGVNILDSLDIVAGTVGNRVVARSIREASASIQQGESLSEPLKRSQIFPPMVTHMIVVGEETGTVETMLNKIADLYEDDVERTLEGLTKLIEPLMMIFVGMLVASILVCLYLPIFNMAGAMSDGVQ
ncbi:type II secretion system F family protein [Candidatus Poribacteria bacterium]